MSFRFDATALPHCFSSCWTRSRLRSRRLIASAAMICFRQGHPVTSVMPRFAVIGGILALVAGVSVAQEQFDRSKEPAVQVLLLRQPRHVKVLVAGEDGKPLSEVRVEHANLKGDLVTDPDGKVEFSTSAPYFVLGRPGYESVRLATEEATDDRATLRKLPAGEQFRVCSQADLSAKVQGWNGVFQLPKARTAKATTEKLDVDYWARGVAAKSRSKLQWGEQGRGPMWGGIEEDEEVWGSARYKEITYRLGSLSVIDAKSWLHDGTCQRSVGFWGESILYYGLNCDSVQPLDDLIDQACAIPDASKRLFP